MNPELLPPPNEVVDTQDWGNHKTVRVVGVTYRDEGFEMLWKRGVISKTPMSQFIGVNLVPEPDNDHDPEAIAVYVGQIHVGYIPRNSTDTFHELLANNREFLMVPAILTTQHDGRWRVHMEVASDVVYDNREKKIRG
jgi:hypothetical protein